MKKMKYIYVCLGVLLLAVLPAKAASEAEFGKLSYIYTLHADGSQEMRVYKELTLFTHTAMNGLYGESFVVYNPAYQELKIHESYTRRKDGSIVKTPANAFVEVLPAGAADAPAYNGLKEMVVVHTALELGATICLDYSVVTRAGYLPELDVCLPVGELSPVKEYVCSVSVPEDKPLNYVLVNAKAEPTVKEEQGNKTVTWTLKNLPAYYPTESLPALSGNMPVVLANTYPSMAGALNVLKSQFTASHEKEVADQAQKLLQGKSGAECEKVLKDYVDGLGYVRLSLSETGYRIRPASEVIRTAYATEAEKMNLLVGLLQAAGLSGEVKVAYSVKAPDACLGLSAISQLFLDSPVVADRQDYQPVSTLDGKKAVLEPDSRSVNETDTLTVTPETGKILAGGYRLITLPHAGAGVIGKAYGMGGTRRTTNLLLASKVDETYRCIVRVPSEFRLCTLPKETVINNVAGRLKITLQATGDEVEVIRSLQLNKQLITPAEYADFHRLMSEWEDSHHTTLLLEEKK